MFDVSCYSTVYSFYLSLYQYLSISLSLSLSLLSSLPPLSPLPPSPALPPQHTLLYIERHRVQPGHLGCKWLRTSPIFSCMYNLRRTHGVSFALLRSTVGRRRGHGRGFQPVSRETSNRNERGLAGVSLSYTTNQTNIIIRRNALHSPLRAEACSPDAESLLLPSATLLPRSVQRGKLQVTPDLVPG